MNDYFLKILIRQRHEEICTELKTARLSRMERPHMVSGCIRVLQSLLGIEKILDYRSWQRMKGFPHEMGRGDHGPLGRQ